MIATGIIVVVGIGVIAYLWWTGHPQIIDRGDGPGNKREFWNAHSKMHVLGAAIVAFVPALMDGFAAGLLTSVVLWTLVEVAQAFPRDRQGGMFEFADLFWDYIGAFVGAWLGALVGGLLWR